MISIDVVPVGKAGLRFNFEISRLGSLVCVCHFEKLSDDCVRLSSARGPHGEKINNEISRKVYDMGFKRIVLATRPGGEVTSLARLQRKAKNHWAYVVPLEEMYGSNN